jgi:hypothetical protein
MAFHIGKMKMSHPDPNYVPPKPRKLTPAEARVFFASMVAFTSALNSNRVR